jgi:hypothetical protein
MSPVLATRAWSTERVDTHLMVPVIVTSFVSDPSELVVDI